MVYRTFPFRLHHILEEASKSKEEACVISWTPCGTSFKIHDLEGFKETVLPKYLPKQSKYKSFKRQLQYYGFTNFGSNQYGHSSFLRDQKSLLCQIEHRAFKKSKGVSSAAKKNKPIDPPRHVLALTNDILPRSICVSPTEGKPTASLTGATSNHVTVQRLPQGVFSLPSSSSSSSSSIVSSQASTSATESLANMAQNYLWAQECRQIAERAQALRALATERGLLNGFNPLANLALLRELQEAKMLQSLQAQKFTT